MNDLDLLINRYLDETASREEVATLNDMLRADIQARRAFTEQLNLDSALAEAAAGLPGKLAAVEDIVTLNQRAVLSNAIAYALMALAAAITLAAGGWFWLVNTSRSQSPTASPVAQAETAKQDDASLAVLVNAAGVRFAAGLAPRGNQFGVGNFELIEGIAHLRFAPGAEMIVTAPAKWSVEDSMHVHMEYGKTRVIVPHSAKGFSVRTPDAEYIDLGTEFGLDVDRQQMASDLYVFDGQVNVALQAPMNVVAEVFEGESARHSQGVAKPAPKMGSADFPTPNQIGLVRWQNHINRVVQTPGLIGFFPFHKTNQTDLLKNDVPESTHRVSDGRIVGARWVSGRWPGKGSLLFDGDDERVELDISGEFKELTIAAWIKIDRLDYEMNAILNSDELQPGDVHFQITRQGLPKGGVQIGLAGSATNDTYIGEPLKVGNWVHVAMVISSIDRVRNVYADGLLVRSGVMSHDVTIRPGMCRLGNWLPFDGQREKRTRAFRGRIDELAVWNRALQPGELRELVVAGSPNGYSAEK